MTAAGRATGPAAPAAGRLDVARLRREFPILATKVNGHPLVYLDNAATAQKPRSVIEAEADFALLENANVHRGVHTLSQRATAAYDAARETLRAFLNAPDAAEVVFTAGTTAGLNLLAQSYGRAVLRPGDEILLTEMEHHSNIVPWQLLAEQVGAVVRAIPVTPEGALDMDAAVRLIGERTRIVAVAHVSNVLGTVNPVAELARLAHARGAVLVVDGAQAVAHVPVDVQALGCDFYVASAHKMYGPTGVGVLWGRMELLDAMPPWQGGGGMIQQVDFAGTTFAPPPAKFEAGTPPIAQAIGMAAAARWLKALPWAEVEAHEHELLEYATTLVSRVPGLRLVGTTPDKVSVLSFVMDGIHPHDVGTVLDTRGVAVRASHHCAQPLMRRLGTPGTVRASFAVYNTRAEAEAMAEGLGEVGKVFGS
jgi:cysteine desulfurase/selenocysteine lyase